MIAYISKGTAMLCFIKYLARYLPESDVNKGFLPIAVKEFESLLHQTPNANVIEADLLFKEDERVDDG